MGLEAGATVIEADCGVFFFVFFTHLEGRGGEQHMGGLGHVGGVDVVVVCHVLTVVVL